MGSIEKQESPRLYTELNNIVDIICAANHCLVLDNKGFVYTWGCGEQKQLGRHITERFDVTEKRSLASAVLRIRRKKYKAMYTGTDHSFAVDMKDKVWAWGINNFDATGIAKDAGDGNATVCSPQKLASLNNP